MVKATLAVLSVIATIAAAAVKEFNVYTAPITLLPGQVHNTAVPPIAVPADIQKQFLFKKMGVVKFQFDLVRFEGNTEISVPLYELYDHHTLQLMGPTVIMDYFYKQLHTKIPGGRPPAHCGSHLTNFTVEHDQLVSNAVIDGYSVEVWEGPIGGAEYRDADRDLPAPYRAVVDTPQSLVAVLHIINTLNATGPKDWPRLFECPCTSARKFDYAKGTIDGLRPLPFSCSTELIAQHNNACNLSWYKGGYRCCENGTFVDEEPDLHAEATTFYGKFTIRYDDRPVGPSTRHVVYHSLDCTGGNGEYDIPKCNPATDGDCIHVVNHTVMFFDNAHRDAFDPVVRTVPAGSTIEILTARGHQHLPGLGMELWNDKTGELICANKPVYGNSTKAGDEKGYAVGIPPCTWGPAPMKSPPRFQPEDRLRIVSRYDARKEHYGVMCFWFLQVAVTTSSVSPVVV